MNKYLVVASDERSYLDLKNVVLELKNRNLSYFFLYNDLPTKLSPQSSLEHFKYDTNIIPPDNTYSSQTLGFELPFSPTVLLITGENWEPEKSILWEFKQQGCFIGCIENSTWNFNNIKTKLELASRKSFPTNCIDVFFDHSDWALETKKEAGWWNQKSIVTGNPKFDDFTFDSTNEDIIIVYGSMEREHHFKLLEIYKNIKEKFPLSQVYYKPHPVEQKDFNDLGFINIIETQKEYLKILAKSSYNVGIFSSVMCHPLLMGKNIVVVDFKTSGIDDELDIEKFKGHEFNFWQRILNFKDFKNFEDFISDEYILNIKKRNKQFEDNLKRNLAFYDDFCTFKNKKSNTLEVIKYFDKFNDKKASKRIINYIENE
tara:strand:+ start:1598 stop:2716 length:1119 start_codon:yes stop_codon:yes gene_type:complete